MAKKPTNSKVIIVPRPPATSPKAIELQSIPVTPPAPGEEPAESESKETEGALGLAEAKCSIPEAKAEESKPAGPKPRGK